MTGAHTCPRRMHEMGPWKREEGLDAWTSGHGGPSCSFCGSLHPDRFMKLVRDGWVVGPTDKNYKAYLSRPLTDEEQAVHKARWLGGFTAQELRDSALARGETADATHAALEAAYYAQVAPLTAGSKEAKFYFQHLTHQQQQEFVDLYRTERMEVGYPGRFYQPPFFMQFATSERNSPQEGA
ncbi:hypothetical protein ABZ281_00735 [Streptomyces sp. NPDC006265]|uniref:hypothetical protein n=1 Tax=Streptomyces sp. NPDC006265 TaxID=3156740 RepID=UPI0033BE4662